MRKISEDRRPLLRSWSAVYAVVALWLMVMIFLLYRFTIHYR